MHAHAFKKRSIRITNIPFILMVHEVVFNATTFTKEGSTIIFVIAAVSRLHIYGVV